MIKESITFSIFRMAVAHFTGMKREHTQQACNANAPGKQAMFENIVEVPSLIMVNSHVIRMNFVTNAFSMLTYSCFKQKSEKVLEMVWGQVSCDNFYPIHLCLHPHLRNS
jgi:hypothetical protein